MGFARQKWEFPGGRVLPIMVRKTPFAQIPEYLRAVTILEPKGNIEDETSSAVDKMRPKRRTGLFLATVPILMAAVGVFVVHRYDLTEVWWNFNWRDHTSSQNMPSNTFNEPLPKSNSSHDQSDNRNDATTSPSIPISKNNSCNAADLVKINYKYDRSIITWLSYVDIITRLASNSEAEKILIKYGDTSFSLHDADQISGFFKRKTGFKLSQAGSETVILSDLNSTQHQAFIDCFDNAQNNIDVIVPSGSEQREEFAVTIRWHPTYVSGDLNGAARHLQFLVTNGTVIGQDKAEIAPNSSMVFIVKRLDMFKVFNFQVSVDGQLSRLLDFPANPSSTINLFQNQVTSPLLRRSGAYGPSAATLGPLCITPTHDGILIPSTARSTKAGAGYEWDLRTNVSISEIGPNQVCMIVSSRGVPGVEERYFHQIQGTLSVTEAYITSTH